MATQFTTVELKNQFEQLAYHIPIAVAMFDRDMRYLFTNERWLVDYELDKSIIGKSHYEVFQEISDDWKVIHERCLQGHIHQDDEVPFPRLDGTLDWLKREIRPWYDASDDAIGGLLMYTDVITERKQAQDALKAQHQFLRQVIDLNTSFIFAKDIEGRFTLVNKALADAYGASPEEMIGKFDEDYNSNPAETQHFYQDDLEVVTTRQPKFIPEEPVSNINGETRWYQTIKVPLIAEDRQSVQLLGIATDITERKKAQDELQRQHRFLRQIIDLNTSLIFAKDQEGKFTLVNKALADDFGVTPDEMVGKTDADFNTDAVQVHNIRRDDLQVLRTRQPKFILEEPITSTVTGETRWFQTIKAPLVSEDGGTVQLLGVGTDITERKKAQEKLQQLVIQEQAARQAAEEASRMKDWFMANMSHELRTPMNAIIGFLREMIYSEKLNDDNLHMTERCLANSKRLLILISSVLDLSRIETDGLEIFPVPVSLVELAQVVKDDLALQAKQKNLKMEIEVSDDLPVVIITKNLNHFFHATALIH